MIEYQCLATLKSYILDYWNLSQLLPTWYLEPCIQFKKDSRGQRYELSGEGSVPIRYVPYSTPKYCQLLQKLAQDSTVMALGSEVLALLRTRTESST